MDTNHGQIFVNFGAPMSLFDYFQANRSVYWCPNEPNAQILTKDRRQSIGSLAREIIEQQQKLYVLTTFNLICTYFNYRSLSNETCNLPQLKYGIDLLANFLKKFDALLSCDIPLTKVSNIIDSLEIHSNILSIQSNNNIQLVAGPRIANTTNVDPKKLKGHALSASTMQRSLPSIVLQTYVNPCLFWLHQPAFYLLARKMNVPKIEMAAAVQRMKLIFVNEFITRNDASIGTMKESIGLWERLDIAGNDELSNLLLASIVPFVFCYFNVVDVIKSQVSPHIFQSSFIRLSFFNLCRLPPFSNSSLNEDSPKRNSTWRSKKMSKPKLMPVQVTHIHIACPWMLCKMPSIHSSLSII